jgi:chemotaxis protein MotB
VGKKKIPEKDTSERYIIPYADLITLLLAFFIVLYAMSDPNEEKIESLGDSFADAFNVSIPFEPVGFEKEVKPREHREPVTEKELKQMKSVSEQNELRELEKLIKEKIAEEGLQEDVNTELNASGLHIVLTNKVLFETASDELKNESSKKLIKNIGIIVETVDNPISIEGHTDNVPINTEKFKSNWDLSSSRALSILKEMTESKSTNNLGNYSATGYGEYRPLVENSDENGKARNRRVEIVIKRISGDNLLEPGSEAK